MQEPLDALVSEAVTRLRLHDSRAADRAAQALQQLVGPGGFDSLTQYVLQEFLWYSLAWEWPGDRPEKEAVAEALARVLELAGLPRYAELCSSPRTSSVIAAFDEGWRQGVTAMRRAAQRAG